MKCWITLTRGFHAVNVRRATQRNEGWLAGTAIDPVRGIGLSFLMRLGLTDKPLLVPGKWAYSQNKYIFLI